MSPAWEPPVYMIPPPPLPAPYARIANAPEDLSNVTNQSLPTLVTFTSEGLMLEGRPASVTVLPSLPGVMPQVRAESFASLWSRLCRSAPAVGRWVRPYSSGAASAARWASTSVSWLCTASIL